MNIPSRPVRGTHSSVPSQYPVPLVKMTTTREDFHLGWCIPNLIDDFIMADISSGAATRAHLRILYPIPVEPGADVLDVDLSVSSISLKVTGSKRRVLWLVPSKEKSPWIGLVGVNHELCIRFALSSG